MKDNGDVAGVEEERLWKFGVSNGGKPIGT